MTSSEEPTQGDALAAIAEMEPGALKLVGDLMAHNARSNEWLMEQLYEGEKAAHERTKEKLREANERLDVIEERHDWLLGGDHFRWEV